MNSTRVLARMRDAVADADPEVDEPEGEVGGPASHSSSNVNVDPLAVAQEPGRRASP